MTNQYTDARAAMRAQSANAWKAPLNGTPTADAVAYARGAASAALVKANRLLKDVGNYNTIDAAYQARQSKDAAQRVRDGEADVLKFGKASAQPGANGSLTFKAPSPTALKSAADVASAAAIVSAKTDALLDILRAENAAIVLIERGQQELEAAQQHLESVLAAKQNEATDAAQDYLAKLARARRGY